MRVSRLIVLLCTGVLCAGLVAVFCRSTPPATAQPPPVPVVSAPVVSGSVVPPNGVDYLFAEMMVGHHAQAVALSRSLLAKPDVVPAVRDVAAYIVQDQQREIGQMTEWLTAWGRGAPDPAASAGHEGHGMLTAGQLAGFEASPDPGRVFLALMIEHHRGAITMARAALAGGRNAYVRGVAKHVVNEQSAENDAMSALLQQP